MLKIERSEDSRVVKSILHRIADIPGGCTVDNGELGGSALLEGTPLAYLASDGMYHVAKTAKLVTDAAEDATEYEVAKGHHFKVGDYFAAGSADGQAITAIDKTTNTDKDVITVGTTLGEALTADDGVVCYQTSGSNTTVKYPPTAIAGSNLDVEESSNIFMDIWVIAVVREGNAPGVTTTLKGTMKGIHYIV